jgi:hypothetical protein
MTLTEEKKEERRKKKEERRKKKEERVKEAYRWHLYYLLAEEVKRAK